MSSELVLPQLSPGFSPAGNQQILSETIPTRLTDTLSPELAPFSSDNPLLTANYTSPNYFDLPGSQLFQSMPGFSPGLNGGGGINDGQNTTGAGQGVGRNDVDDGHDVDGHGHGMLGMLGDEYQGDNTSAGYGNDDSGGGYGVESGGYGVGKDNGYGGDDDYGGGGHGFDHDGDNELGLDGGTGGGGTYRDGIGDGELLGLDHGFDEATGNKHDYLGVSGTGSVPQFNLPRLQHGVVPSIGTATFSVSQVCLMQSLALLTYY